MVTTRDGLEAMGALNEEIEIVSEPAVLAVALSAEEVAALDEWRVAQPDQPVREAAAAILIAEALTEARRRKARRVGPEDEDRRVRAGEAGGNDD